MATKRRETRVHEIEVERLVLREPGGGRIRAVLETVPSRRGRAPGVRLSLLGADGSPALVLGVDRAGDPDVVLGKPGDDARAVFARQCFELWSAGNVVAAMWSGSGGGTVELGDADGAPLTTLPERDDLRAP